MMKNRLGKLLIIAILFTMTCIMMRGIFALKVSAEEEFERAARLYDASQFEQARNIYTSLIRDGYHDPVVYYNLGNTYARLGETGPSVLNYYKALRLDPNNQDIIQNLNTIQPAINRSSGFFLLKPFGSLKNLMNVNQWAILCSILLFMVCVARAAAWLTRSQKATRIFKKITLIILIPFIISILFLLAHCYTWILVDSAVVMEADILARSGPGAQFEELYKLPAGTKVRIISDPVKGWVRIRLMDGKSAFLPLTEIRRIDFS